MTLTASNDSVTPQKTATLETVITPTLSVRFLRRRRCFATAHYSIETVVLKPGYLRTNRRDVDDAAALLIDHTLHEGARGQKQAARVDVHDTVVFFVGDVLACVGSVWRRTVLPLSLRRG